MRSSVFAVLVSALLTGVSGAVERRLMVGFQEGTSADQRAQVLSRNGFQLIEFISELELAIVSVPNDGSGAVQMMNTPIVSMVEEDFFTNWLVAVQPAPLPLTPLPALEAAMASLPKLERLSAEDGEIPWGVERVNAPAAWTRTRGRGVSVAVLDTGVDCFHPDLASNCASNGYNAADESLPWTDDHDHGTHVAGTIAAEADGSGVAGVAPAATIVPVKVLDQDGNGRLSWIIKGVLWAAERNIDIINMSLGASRGSVFFRAAVDHARASGTTIVAAAGNTGLAVTYPAAYSGVISVSASDRSNRIAVFSSRGASVDFIAPGVDIKSTVRNRGFRRLQGTSMAAPHVSGLAALAKSALHEAGRPSGPDAITAALTAAASSLGLPSEHQGRGLIDGARITAR